MQALSVTEHPRSHSFSCYSSFRSWKVTGVLLRDVGALSSSFGTPVDLQQWLTHIFLCMFESTQVASRTKYLLSYWHLVQNQRSQWQDFSPADLVSWTFSMYWKEDTKSNQVFLQRSQDIFPLREIFLPNAGSPTVAILTRELFKARMQWFFFITARLHFTSHGWLRCWCSNFPWKVCSDRNQDQEISEGKW